MNRIRIFVKIKSLKEKEKNIKMMFGLAIF